MFQAVPDNDKIILTGDLMHMLNQIIFHGIASLGNVGRADATQMESCLYPDVKKMAWQSPILSLTFQRNDFTIRCIRDQSVGTVWTKSSSVEETCLIFFPCVMKGAD